MKENLRVRLSIIVWGALMVLLFVVATMVFSDDDTSGVDPLFQNVAQDAMRCKEIDGVAITVIERDGTTHNTAYGSLASGVIGNIKELSSLSYARQLMCDVERGVITLDNAIGSWMGVGHTDFSLSDASCYAIMLLNEGVADDTRLLSPAAVKELLTPNFGWHSPQYSSLLSEQTVEFCSKNSAIILDYAAGKAIVIVVDGSESFDADYFATMRSKIASVVAAME